VVKLEQEVRHREDRCVKLELEVQKCNRELAKLQSERADKCSTQKAKDDARIKELEELVAQSQSKLASHQALTVTVGMLKEKVEKKEAETAGLLADKEKLEAYSKQKIHGVQEKYMSAIKTCKDQLAEKDLKLQRVNDQYKQLRHSSQRENQLLISAIYELGMSVTEHRLVRSLDTSGSIQPKNKAEK
jgi:chromosome segregation ATPase